MDNIEFTSIQDLPWDFEAKAYGPNSNGFFFRPQEDGSLLGFRRGEDEFHTCGKTNSEWMDILGVRADDFHEGMLVEDSASNGSCRRDSANPSGGNGLEPLLGEIQTKIQATAQLERMEIVSKLEKLRSQVEGKANPLIADMVTKDREQQASLDRIASEYFEKVEKLQRYTAEMDKLIWEMIEAERDMAEIEAKICCLEED